MLLQPSRLDVTKYLSILEDFNDEERLRARLLRQPNLMFFVIITYLHFTT